MNGQVLLREVFESDLPIFYEQQLDPVATSTAAFPSRARPAFDAHWQKILADSRNTIRTILYEDQVAGNILSFELADKREVGYWLGREYWGKGIATRALELFLGLVQTRPLFAHVAQHNLGSLRVLQKCGFEICGEDKIPFGEPGVEVAEWILKLE
jgi:RimJ/RimL family protein N-acetyltransferase